MAQQHGLGRGLSSLIPQKKPAYQQADKTDKISEPKDDFNYFGTSPVAKKAEPALINPVAVNNNGGVLEINISKIIPNPHQPRLKIDELKLKELAASIKEHGVIQPLIVSKNNGDWEIIAGERRFLAAKIAGLEKVPVIVREASEQQKLELAVIENIQRHDLNPIEEAKALKKLTDEFDMGQEEIALKMGKSRSAVANKLRLLNLPIEIQRGLIDGQITEGHAKAILAIEDPEKQRALYDLILKNSLTVRQVENKTKEVMVRTHKRNMQIDPEIKRIEDDLSQSLGTRVKLSKSGGGGKILIEYYSKEELDNILSHIK